MFADIIQEQTIYQAIAITDGNGCVERTKHGAFIVYSRISLDSLFKIVSEGRHTTVRSLEDLKTIFLLGPTPKFYGDNCASTSWRREFVKYLEECENINDDFIIILPEPKSCNWQDVDFPGLIGVQHIYAQIHWEDYFINLAARTGVLVLHAHFRWGGNAGPTARLEAGKLLALAREGLIKSAVINCPQDSETAEYIKAHLLDMYDLYSRGRFGLTTCSPLNLNDNNKPIDNEGNIMEAGIYHNGSGEQGLMNVFFKEIVTIALNI